MEKLKELWKELTEKYKTQKLELLLLLAFVVAGALFTARDMAEEASSSRAVEESESTAETETDTETESETETETEAEMEMSQEELEEIRRHDRRRFAKLGRDFIIPMAMPEGYVREEFGNEAGQESGEADAGDEADPESESIAAGDEADLETETADETDAADIIEYESGDRDAESESGDEEMSEGAAAGPENTEKVDYWELRTLKDTQQLYGYELLIPQDEESMFAEMHLEEILRSRLTAYDGDWSVYVKNLETEETILINDKPMKSASVMKLFIMGTVYKAFENGDLARTEETVALLNNMIIYSDNEASNQLLYLLGESDYGRGIEKVNKFIQAYGFSDMTVEYNGFNNPATNMGTGNYNQVSARDCGKILEDIYHREWVSRSVSNEIEQMMLNQNTRYKIPAGLPEGVACGNKTGEMDTTENDAAIIYASECDYILVVLSSDWSSKDQAISRIQSISSLVYRYLCEKE